MNDLKRELVTDFSGDLNSIVNSILTNKTPKFINRSQNYKKLMQNEGIKLKYEKGQKALFEKSN